APQAVAELEYVGHDAVSEECDLFLETIAAAGARFADTFMTAASPGIVTTVMHNAFYESHEAYLAAVARELKTEYDAIAARGLLLQIDAPDLAMERSIMFQQLSDDEFVEIAALHVDAINDATRDVPRERIRLHA